MKGGNESHTKAVSWLLRKPSCLRKTHYGVKSKFRTKNKPKLHIF